MSLELIAGLVTLILALVGGGVGWNQVRKHGAERTRRKQAEGALDVAKAQIEVLMEALPSDTDLIASLKRLRKRARKMRDSVSK